jgi:hypothetical protein
MPLIHIAGQLVQFAHVPRCGGSAVENYLTARFGPLAFLDRRHLKVAESARWSSTSPQHLEQEALARLLPPAWIARSFALVRHPEDRILSVFRYQRDLERTIPADMAFADWLADLPERRADEPHYLDNHPRPASDLVPEGATVFRLEDGMDPVIGWLDRIEGAKRQPRTIAADNAYAARMKQAEREPSPALTFTPELRARIHDLYAVDFDRFGYTPRAASGPDTGETESPA